MGRSVINRPIRVLEVMEATIGGTKRHLLALIRGLDRHLFHVEVAAPKLRSEAFDDVTFADEVREAGIRQHFVPMRRAISPSVDAACLLKLVALMRRGRYDVVHAHSSKAGILGRIAARLAQVPAIVYTPHGFYFLNRPAGRSRDLYLGLERLGGRMTDCLIALSRTELAEAVDNRIVPSTKVALIENGIEVPAPRDPERLITLRRTLAPDSSHLVSTVARMTAQKGPFDFVQMVATLLQRIPSVSVVWCGDGELRDQVEGLARELGVAGRLHFLGYRTDVLDIVAASDLFVLTSHWEGLPYTVLDAMALEKPVVVAMLVSDIPRIKMTGTKKKAITKRLAGAMKRRGAPALRRRTNRPDREVAPSTRVDAITPPRSRSRGGHAGGPPRTVGRAIRRSTDLRAPLAAA